MADQLYTIMMGNTMMGNTQPMIQGQLIQGQSRLATTPTSSTPTRNSEQDRIYTELVKDYQAQKIDFTFFHARVNAIGLDDFGYVLPDVKKARKTRIAKARLSLNKVILAEGQRQQIEDAIKQLDNHDLIFNKWGFGAIFEKGLAVSMLFHGPPGTGKTLIAQCIAEELKSKLIIVGTAEIESMEPGGAERAIKQFFAQAAKNNAILLFDECDSLLYNRNDVGSILGAQVNQLLQSIENHVGVVIFTTNRLGTLDEALNRRLSLKLELTTPTLEMRVDIWKKMFPKKAPLAKDIQWEKLAAIEVTGGYIKNTVLRAARMTANKPKKEQIITFEILVIALKQEVESMIQFDNADKPNIPRLGGRHDLSASVGRTKKIMDLGKHN